MRRATAVLLVGCLAVTVAGCAGDDGGAVAEPAADVDSPVVVTLLPADEPGPDPFGPSFGDALAGSIDHEVRDAIDRPLSTSPIDGATPQLYGRVDLQAPCDKEGLVGYVAGSEELGKTMAAVLDVSPLSLSSFLRSYVEVVLTRDTFVIDHHLVDGDAVATPVVLQAGTTVLIDPSGQPRVRCRSADPLTQPSADDVAAAGGTQVAGEPWPGFDPGQVVVVQPAAEHLQSIDFADLPS